MAPLHHVAFFSHSTSLVLWELYPLEFFYMFSVSHLPGSSREEGKGGPVALDNATRELPVPEEYKPGDILRHTTYLGAWCLQGQFGNLTTL